ncbi:MAG: NADH-quinone oxidoreductase subunit K, partial [Thermodesulfobacteriota bacterium]
MLELIEGYYAYFFLILLFLIGLYGMMIKRNLMKKIFGMSIVQTSVILFWITSAFKENATVTVFDPG